MIRKTLITGTIAAGFALTFSAPVQAGWYHQPGCKWSKPCQPGSTTSSSTSSGSTKVPEPGMLGLMGAGLAGLAVARRKSTRRK